MGVYIKKIKMPTCCDECAFIKTIGLDRWKCKLSGCDFNSWDVGWADGTDNKYIRHSSCPLVPVPPHGRMIDADALIDKVIAKYLKFERKGKLVFAAAEIKQDICDLISEAPTIIPAEEGE